MSGQFSWLVLVSFVSFLFLIIILWVFKIVGFKVEITDCHVDIPVVNMQQCPLMLVVLMGKRRECAICYSGR